jgi:hypothetical protein
MDWVFVYYTPKAISYPTACAGAAQCSAHYVVVGIDAFSGAVAPSLASIPIEGT